MKKKLNIFLLVTFLLLGGVSIYSYSNKDSYSKQLKELEKEYGSKEEVEKAYRKLREVN